MAVSSFAEMASSRHASAVSNLYADCHLKINDYEYARYSDGTLSVTHRQPAGLRVTGGNGRTHKSG